MSLHDLLIAPFADFAFMRRALIACIAISLSAGPIGAFMVLRRMSLMGDAMSHAVLPGVALGFLFFGLDLWPMALGGRLRSTRKSLAARAVRASAAVAIPGAMAPPMNAPSADTHSRVVAVPKSMMMSGPLYLRWPASALRRRSAPTSFGWSMRMSKPQSRLARATSGSAPK